VVTGGTEEPTAAEGEETVMRAYKGVLDLLIMATEHFYMLSPRCWPLLAGCGCFSSELPFQGQYCRERS
jgi:hypothetical protein